MRKYVAILILFSFCFAGVASQSTYTMANFANSGDTVYLTGTRVSNNNFDTSGANITWNFSSLTGVSQRRLIYRLPTQTGYSFLQWPYVYSTSNVNLSATDEQTTAILGLQQTNPNDYFLKNNNLLREKASAYTLVIGSTNLNIKNVYTNPDTVYKFPLQYNSTNTSKGSYAINLPGVYYRGQVIDRKDTVKGWGTVITPFRTFTNALQLVSNIMQVDTLSVTGQPLLTNDTTYYREIKWFDPSQKNPLLNVRQTKTGNIYLTTSVEYIDAQQFYQPVAAFAFVPVLPNMGDTVTFQNLCTNATAYKWNFSDGADSSTAINPQHIFTNAGTYPVKLIAYNGPLSDTIIINLRVSQLNQTYTFTGNGNWGNAANWNNGNIPPSPLPATNQIVINHTAGGQCVLNILQTIETGGSLTVNSGMNLVVQGNLRIE